MLETTAGSGIQADTQTETPEIPQTVTTPLDIMEIVDAMKAEIVDMSQNLMIIQICDLPERTAMMIKLLAQVSIVEIARTGTLALPKCDM